MDVAREWGVEAPRASEEFGGVVEVTTMGKSGRKVTRRPGVDPKTAARPLIVRTP